MPLLFIFITSFLFISILSQAANTEDIIYLVVQKDRITKGFERSMYLASLSFSFCDVTTYGGSMPIVTLSNSPIFNA